MIFELSNFEMNLLQKLIPVLIILVVIGIGGAGYFYWQYTKAQQEIQTIKTDPSTIQKAAQLEVKKIIDDVGKLIALPEGEEPTVATISDIDKLKDQPFFQKAKNGDKVLIYTNAKKAILYDPENKKIIDVAPVSIGTSSAQLATTASPLKVALYNGTNTTGLTGKFETNLNKDYPDLSVSSKENASSSDYKKSQVIYFTEAAKDTASKIAQTYVADLKSVLPEGEKKPKEGDILMILGKDRVQ